MDIENTFSREVDSILTECAYEIADAVRDYHNELASAVEELRETLKNCSQETI